VQEPADVEIERSTAERRRTLHQSAKTGQFSSRAGVHGRPSLGGIVVELEVVPIGQESILRRRANAHSVASLA
jgi:hypothetical protein